MLEVRDLRVVYRSGRVGVERLSFALEPGEALLLLGPSGSGKSSALKAIAGVIPFLEPGTVQGEVRLNGSRINSWDPASRALSGLCIAVQSPDDQLFNLTVLDEAMFGPLNKGLGLEEARAAALRALRIVEMDELRDRFVEELSGGQKQRLVIASLLAMEPKVLLLDEPLSQLDPKCSREVVEALMEVKKTGASLVITEHRVSSVIGLADKVLVLDKGRPVFYGDPKSAVEVMSRIGVRLPKPTLEARKESSNPGGAVAVMKNVCYRYPSGAVALKSASLEIMEGQVTAIVGCNGAGKSTLLKILVGELEPSSGEVLVLGERPRRLRGDPSKISYVPQNPDLCLVAPTVREEIALPLRRRGLSPGIVEEVASRLRVKHLLDRPPHAASRGERLRIAVAAAVAPQPKLIVLDEPTTGQDERSVRAVMEELRRQAERGAAAVFTSHDMEVVAAYADRVVVMKDGMIIADGPPWRILRDQEVLDEAGLAVPPQYAEEG